MHFGRGRKGAEASVRMRLQSVSGQAGKQTTRAEWPKTATQKHAKQEEKPLTTETLSVVTPTGLEPVFSP